MKKKRDKEKEERGERIRRAKVKKRDEDARNRSAIVNLYQTGAGSGSFRSAIIKAYQTGKSHL